MGKWPSAHDDLLKDLKSKGLSFTEIASHINRQFEAGYSRNACIGRALRLGLTESRHSQAAARRERVRRIREEQGIVVAPDCDGNVPHDPKARRRRRRFKIVQGEAPLPPVKRSTVPVGSVASRTIHKIRSAAGTQPLEPDTRPLRCVEIEPMHLSLNDLAQHTCRWPYGGWPTDAPITFCGHWCEKDDSYCDAHQELARSPARGEQPISAVTAHRKALRPTVMSLARDYSGEEDAA